MNYGTIKSVGNGQVDVQLTGSAQVVRNVRISAQVGWNTLAPGTRVLVDTVEGKPVVLHTLTDVPHVYTTAEGQLVVANPGATFPDNALLADGSVPLTGDLPVAPGVKVDGYDISVLGQTIDNLQAADSVARTGYTVMTHASHLVETIDENDTQLKIRHDLFADKETLAVSNTMGQIEHMKVIGEAVATVANDGSVCYLYTVTRRVATNPVGLRTGWAAATLVNGLTLKGYINFDAHDNLLAAPSMRFVLHTNIDANTAEQIVRIGSLVNILGYTVEDYGFAIGRLTSADKYLAYSYADNLFRIRGADIAGADESGTEVFRIWGTYQGGRVPGDYRFGPLAGGHQEWTSETGRLSFFSGANEVIYFSEAGSRFKNMVWAGGETGPQIGIGERFGEGFIIARNSLDVSQFVVRTRSDNDSVYVFAGNPKPQAGWMEFDNGLTVDGTIRARALEIIGQATVSDTGEIIIRDPADPRRYGHIKPHYLAGYTVDSADTQHLSTLISWAPTTLEAVPGSGQWRTWLAGEGFFGDWRYRHFRWERNGRVGLFDGETPKAWMDSAGNFNASGSLTWGNGTGVADDSGVRIDAYDASKGSGDSFNRYSMVHPEANDDPLGWLETYYTATTIGTLLKATSVVQDVNAALYVNSIAPSGKDAQVVLQAVSGANSAGITISKEADLTGTVSVGATAFEIDAITKLGDGGITDYVEVAANGVVTLHGAATLPGKMTIAIYVPGTLAVGSQPIRIHVPNAATITNVTAAVTTAPTGASLILDVHKNGTTVFTTQANRPTITAGNTEDLSSVPDVTSLTVDDVLTIDIDQVGSTVAGADLVVQVRCTINI